jgi:hypothetical protein
LEVEDSQTKKEHGRWYQRREEENPKALCSTLSPLPLQKREKRRSRISADKRLSWRRSR